MADTEKPQAALVELIELIEADAAHGLQLGLGMFVGLAREMVRRHGHDVAREIKIESAAQ